MVKSRPENVLSMKYGISVAVCCYNSSGRVPGTLEYLAQQQVSKKIPWEIIVVDNASTDRTSKAARDSWPENAPCQLRIVKEPKRGLSQHP